MSVYSSVADRGRDRFYVGVAGVNNNDIVIETTDVSNFDTFMLSSGTGAVDIEAHDGLQWLTSPLSLADLGASVLNPVVVTAALRQYGFRGKYQALRIRQNGAAAATGVTLRCFEG